MIRKIIGVILLLMCFLGFIGGGLTDAASAVPFVIFGGIGVLLILKKGKTKEQKQEIKQKKEEQKEFDKTHITLSHMAGLPIAEGVTCYCSIGTDAFTFSAAGNEFSLKFDKITSIDIKTDVEIQKQYVSSVGGAIGGAVLFGPLGAMVGGRAKKKEHVERTHYLIFTYLKDGDVNYISFEISLDFLSKAIGMKSEFDNKYKKNASVIVEL